MLEDALRETFADQVSARPSTVGQSLADRAIARAVTHRRRTRAGTVLAGVMVLVITGVVSFNAVDVRKGPTGPGRKALAGGPVLPTLTTEPSPTGTPVATPAPEPLEVVANGEIYTEGSATAHLALPAHTNGAAVRSAYHADDGYLVVTAQPDTSQQLLLLDKGGDSKVLLNSASTIAVSGDGDKVAWREGTTMSVANRQPDTSTLAATQTAAAPDRGIPVAFVGPDVVLGRTAQSGTGMDAFDLWHPDQQSTYTQSWDEDVLRVFGVLTDGSALFAQVRPDGDADQVCVARLIPDQPFKETDRACGLPQPAPQGGGISPDGRYLVYAAADGQNVAVVDLKQVFKGTPKARLADLGTTFDPTTVRVVWLGPQTAVVNTGGSFVTVDPTQPSKVESPQANNGGKVLVQPLNP